MSDNNLPKANGGMGNLLSTLASSGDNWVKLIIVGGLFYNTVMTNKNGTGIKDTNSNIKDNSRELIQFRKAVARQVQSIYANQNFLFDFVDEVRGSQDRIQTALNIPHAPSTPYPRREIPESLTNPFPDEP